MKTADADVGKYLSMFTFLNEDQVKEIMNQHEKNPDQRLAQTTLANETTELVHGGKVSFFFDKIICDYIRRIKRIFVSFFSGWTS